MHARGSFRRAIGKGTSALRRGSRSRGVLKRIAVAEGTFEEIFRFVNKLPMARPQLTAASLASIILLPFCTHVPRTVLHRRGGSPAASSFALLFYLHRAADSTMDRNSALQRPRHLRDRDCHPLGGRKKKRSMLLCEVRKNFCVSTRIFIRKRLPTRRLIKSTGSQFI